MATTETHAFKVGDMVRLKNRTDTMMEIVEIPEGQPFVVCAKLHELGDFDFDPYPIDQLEPWR